jgi:hypothetical protein
MMHDLLCLARAGVSLALAPRVLFDSSFLLSLGLLGCWTHCDSVRNFRPFPFFFFPLIFFLPPVLFYACEIQACLEVLCRIFGAFGCHVFMLLWVLLPPLR